MVSRNPPLSLIMKNNFSGPGKLEWLARFMVSHGVPYEALYETSFRKFLREYVPNLVIPLPSAMESVVNRIGEHGVQVIPAEVDEISVTFDIFGDEDEGHKCIAFSVHYSPWVYGFGARRNIVYLRKLDDGPLSAQRIIEFIREAINKDQQKYLKIANIVIPNRKLAALFNMKNAVIKHTICFNHCVDTFVTEVLQIEEIAATIEKYREIVKSIRTNEELFVEFKRYLNGIGAPSDLPSYRKDGWRSVSAFAARCLELNDVITHLSFDVDTLSEQLLNFVHKMLEKCSQYSGYISQSGSSISQVIPTILLIKHEMKRQIDGLPPEETVKSIFSEIFMPLTSGEQRQQYDLASLLDPRFAYRSALYTEEEWDDIEKTLLVEFLKKYQVINAPVEDENQYEATVSVYRSTGIVEELESYRNYCLTKRPKEKDNPWQWWTCRQDHMRHLAIMAREIGVCPAVSIDADYFFGSGGKFSHFAKHYTPDQLNKVLILAGYQQKFRGSGASFELAEESNTFDETDLEEGRNNYTVYELAMNKRHKKENYLRMSVEGKKTEEIPAARILSGETLPTPVDNLQPVTEQKPDLYLESTEIKQEKDNMPSTSEYEPNYVDYEISEIDPEEIELLKTEPVELELNPEEQAWLQEEDEVYYPPLSSAPGEEDDEVSEYNMEDDLDDGALISSDCSYSPPPKKRSTRRTCSICEKMQARNEMKEIILSTEKILVILSAVYRNEIDDETGRELFSKNRFPVCRAHYAEASASICEMLGVEQFEEIAHLPMEAFDDAIPAVAAVCGKNIAPMDLRDAFYAFCERYNAEAMARMLQSAATKKRNKFEVIELDSDDDDGGDEIATCRCCQRVAHRSQMVKMPRRAVEWREWMNALQVPYDIDHEKRKTHYLCKHHFPENSFTKQGRLRKGVLPLEFEEESE